MQAVLDDMVRNKYIKGALVCTEEGKIVGQHIPSNLDGEKIAAWAVKSIPSEQKYADFVMKHQKVLARSLKRGCLVILCARKASISMVNILANWAVKTLNRNGGLTSEAPRSQTFSEDLFPDNSAVMDCLNRVIQAVGHMVDNVCGTGMFSKSFRKSLVAMADSYSFLDPFSGISEYQDGSLHIPEIRASQTQLVWGVSDCLICTLHSLDADRLILRYNTARTQDKLMSQCGAQLKELSVDRAFFDRVFGGCRRD